MTKQKTWKQIHILIGHRGTGKTHFCNQLKSFYFKNNRSAYFFDLDQEIEHFCKESVDSLFTKGESFFRKKEKEVFQKLIQSLAFHTECFISVGAGFRFKKNPAWNVIHLSRSGDQIGRVFLNKPRLKPRKGAFEEFLFFYKKRQKDYLKQADEHLFRREHFKSLELSDLLFFGLKKIRKPYFTIRLNPKDLPQSDQKIKFYLQKRMGWALRYFELNDETADKDFIECIRQFVPEEKLLFSSQTSTKFLSIKNKINWSWDLALGKAPQTARILTLHNRRGKNMKSLLSDFSLYKNRHLKLAVEIHNLKELKTAYDWFRKDLKNRSLLPKSKEGRWLWFRQVFGPQMHLHFIKEKKTKGEVLDQPFLSEALPFLKKNRTLGAVIGDPVSLSATPAWQGSFFESRFSTSILSVPLKESEMTKESLKIFEQLGFVFFAVTSPLKKQAFACAELKDEFSKKFQSVNTLIFDKNQWKAFNTDYYGLEKLKKYSSESTVVWGGGGIRLVLKELLPKAKFYSARTGKPYFLKKEPSLFSPKILIWAVGRKRMQEACLMPPKSWKPSKVIDINYTEDSPGLEYALNSSSRYVSGLECFKVQAKKQRDQFKCLNAL